MLLFRRVHNCLICRTWRHRGQKRQMTSSSRVETALILAW